MNNRILLVEDNDIMRLGITETLLKEGFHVNSFDNGLDAIEFYKNEQHGIAVLDLKMEPINGIEVLKNLKKINNNVEVLLISAFGTVDDAVEAIKSGACDFLTKPFSPDELRIRIRRINEIINNREKIQDLIEHNRMLNDEINSGYSEIVSKDKGFLEILNYTETISGNDSSVLITGESGTGKEVIARKIHFSSPRKNNPFIKLNCGALNENLLESELFGHEKGAFTGAVKNKKGRFELADKGTLFLDEIGDISPSMQVKLLRVLQENEFERVGGEETIKVNVRIIAATNKDLKKMITKNEFREDLFYRLNVLPVHLPPLRERKTDIELLADFFLKKFATKNSKEKIELDNKSVELLSSYSWPGNIRELENLMERLSVINIGKYLNISLLLSHLNTSSTITSNYDNLPLEDAVFNFEKNLITHAMQKADNIKNRAAKILGISTSVLYYKLEKFGLL